MERLFHLAPVEPWERFLCSEDAAWRPPSLANEGFVHLSFAAQLAGTLGAHFAREDALYLLELDAAKLGDALCVEPSRDGQPFPHLYRALGRDELVGSWRLVRDERWSLPVLGTQPADDRPPASGPLALPSP